MEHSITCCEGIKMEVKGRVGTTEDLGEHGTVDKLVYFLQCPVCKEIKVI